MNNTNNYSSYSPTQPLTSDSSSNDLLAGVLASGALMIILSIAIFIIWVWSMISMITLNGRFKDFYDDYQRRESERNPAVTRSAPIAYSEVPSETVSEESSTTKDRASWLNKKPSTASVIILLALILVLVAVILFSVE